MPAAVLIATVAEPVAMRIIAATVQPISSGESSKRCDSAVISAATPVFTRMPLRPPPAPTSRVIAAVGARHSCENRRICSRSKPRISPRVTKLSSVASSSATTELPTKCRKPLSAPPGTASASAQPPSSISPTGSSSVATVMPKPGRASSGASPWPSSSSARCMGLCGGSATRGATNFANTGPASAAVGSPTSSA